MTSRPTTMSFTEIDQLAQREMLKPGILLKLDETPQSRGFWSGHGVPLQTPCKKSVCLRIAAKRQTRQSRQNEAKLAILERYADEISKGEETNCDELVLLAGLASREALAIYDGGEIEAPIVVTPREWGILLLGQLQKITRVKLGNLAKADHERRNRVVSKAIQAAKKIRDGYFGEAGPNLPVELFREATENREAAETTETPQAEETEETRQDELAALIAEQAADEASEASEESWDDEATEETEGYWDNYFELED